MGAEDFGGDVETDAHASFFFAEEKLGVARERGGAETGTGVGKDEFAKRSGSGRSRAHAFANADMDRECAASSGYGLDRVYDHVADCLAESARVCGDLEAGARFVHDADACMLGRGCVNTERGGDQFAGIARGSLRRLRARQKHPLVHERLDLRVFREDDRERIRAAVCMRCGRVDVRRAGLDELRVEFDGGDGIVDLVRESGGHAAKCREALSLLTGAAFIGKRRASIEVGAGELADFVGASDLGRRLGIFIPDSRQALRERAQRPHDVAREHPRERERERPECTQHRKRPEPPESACRGFESEKHEGGLPVYRNPHAFTPTPRAHLSGGSAHRFGQGLAFVCRDATGVIRHPIVSESGPEIDFHSENFA